MATTNWVMDDVDITVVPGGLDDGAFTAGTPVTFLADKVSFNREVSTADHSAGQALVAQHRTTKVDWTIDVELKVDSGGAVLDALAAATNQLIGIACTGGSGTGLIVSGNGLLVGPNIEPGAPSMLKFQVKAYGTDLTISTP